MTVTARESGDVKLPFLRCAGAMARPTISVFVSTSRHHLWVTLQQS
jgi:hypothetical protein